MKNNNWFSNPKTDLDMLAGAAFIAVIAAGFIFGLAVVLSFL